MFLNTTEEVIMGTMSHCRDDAPVALDGKRSTDSRRVLACIPESRGESLHLAEGMNEQGSLQWGVQRLLE